LIAFIRIWERILEYVRDFEQLIATFIAGSQVQKLFTFIQILSQVDELTNQASIFLKAFCC